MEYSSWLKTMRKKKGYSQAELANRLNLTREVISSWERGIARPNFETLQKIFKLYQCTDEEILLFINPNNDKK
jgi:transcriptional regulator with XRE-family HTH domain